MDKTPSCPHFGPMYEMALHKMEGLKTDRDFLLKGKDIMKKPTGGNHVQKTETGHQESL